MKKRIIFIICAVLISTMLFGCNGTDKNEGIYDGLVQYDYKSNVEDNDEEYTEIEENDFVLTDIEPFSTFSADVDTASYSNLRRMINAGYLMRDIPKDAIRTEEMLNYFSYDYKEPNSGEVFGVTATIGNSPWCEDTKLLIVGISTAEVDYSEIPSSNYVFLVDVSGSMESENKLPLLKQSLIYLTDQLSEDDRISIVTYAAGVKVLLNGASGDEKSTIKKAINDLSSGGSTNGEAGMEKAYELARDNYISSGNNRIIMASDGDLNVGISSEDELLEFIQTKRDAGIYLSVLGFGDGNYKDSKMEILADNGNGNYYYIDCLDEAKKVFGRDLCATLTTVAEDVKFQLEFNPDYIKGYRMIGYENRVLTNEDFENDERDAGEVGAGHCVTVAYELIMTNSDKAIDTVSVYETADTQTVFAADEWMELNIRYKNPSQSESKLIEHRIGKVNFTETPSDDFKFAGAVIEFSMVLRDSKYLDNGSVKHVLQTLESIALTDSYKTEFKSLVYKLDDNS